MSIKEIESGFVSLKFGRKNKNYGFKGNIKDVHQQREKEIYKQIRISDTCARGTATKKYKLLY